MSDTEEATKPLAALASDDENSEDFESGEGRLITLIKSSCEMVSF